MSIFVIESTEPDEVSRTANEKGPFYDYIVIQSNIIKFDCYTSLSSLIGNLKILSMIHNFEIIDDIELCNPKTVYSRLKLYSDLPDFITICTNIPNQCKKEIDKCLELIPIVPKGT